MEKVITKDGSVTFHNKEYDETYHSVSGAKEESEKKYIIPAAKRFEELNDVKIEELEEISILDVCFGLGYNTTAAIDFLHKINPDMKIYVIGLEYDPEILSRIKEIDTGHKSQEYILKALDNDYAYSDGNVSIRIIIGDAKERIKDIDEKERAFHFIFHDPFSTKKSPELWSASFFSEEFRLLKEGGILTTYSCARMVKDALEEAGFVREDVESVGRRAPSTLAYK